MWNQQAECTAARLRLGLASFSEGPSRHFDAYSEIQPLIDRGKVLSVAMSCGRSGPKCLTTLQSYSHPGADRIIGFERTLIYYSFYNPYSIDFRMVILIRPELSAKGEAG